ncbi:MAG: type 2 lanthipeptide synthetase LanM [Sneathiella sp.]|uniref:type 2 lanthipeptide synthetase LanM n=1 Tax=Sneathiella sp. TaxID=1964365 RepID=UPI0030020741
MTAQAKPRSSCTTANLNSAQESFTIQELRILAARASTLEERLTGQYVPKETQKNFALAKSRFKTWIKSASGGDPFLMGDILAEQRIDPSKAEPLFGDVTLGSNQHLPEWTNLLKQLLSNHKENEPTHEAYKALPKDLLSHEKIFYPLVEKARHLRDVKTEDNWLQNLSCEALLDLDFALLESISDCCIKATNTAAKFGISSEQNTTIQIVNKEGLKKFFYKRPVLARLITTMAAQWQATTLEFLERLYQDLSTEIFSLTQTHTTGKVTNIEYGLSELYNEGKSVYKLTFENNLSIGYKPRDLRIDQAWNTLIQWLDSHGAPLSAGVPNTQVCNGYGWVEWIAPKSCETIAEAEEFFQRSGATLCLIRLLQGNDFHFGNIIGSGTTPIPLDLETIVQAQPKRNTQLLGAEKAFEKASEAIVNSVLNTGYLPGWFSTSNEQTARLGGLDNVELSSTPIDSTNSQSRKISNKNTHYHNIPSLHGSLLNVKEYEKLVIAGYEAMFAFFIKHGPRVIEFGGPLDTFQNVSFRSILRPTHVYTKMMEKALKPKNLGNGVTWNSYFDMLLRSEFTREEFNATAVFRNYERACLTTFNIPFYSGTPTSVNLLCGDQRIVKDFFNVPCLDQVKSRLQNLNSEILKGDRLMIQQCISVTKIVEPHGSLPAAKGSFLAPASNKRIIEQAKILEKEINKSALKSGGGSAWLGLLPVTADERKLQLSILPPSFFCGTLGIGLFQAALYKITSEEIYRSRAVETTAIVLERARDIAQMQRMGHSMSLGLGFGLGGIIYALVAFADMLNESRYLSFAQIFAQTITPAKIASSKDCGLMSGVAGSMIGLQAFYHRYPSPEIANQIRDCGRHLLDSSTALTCGSKAWRSQNWAVPLTGLMHGASGIALALSRAAKVFNLPQFNDAAIDGLEYESALRNRFGSWPDLRDVDNSTDFSPAPQLLGYANGLAGIGLVRLELEALKSPYTSYSEDIDYAVKRLSNQSLSDADDLFSGNIGILFFLVRAARDTRNKKLEKQALSQISSVLINAQKKKSFQWRVGNDAENPGFFNGAAGVGMALLQIASPDQIPDILSLRHSN